MDNWETYDGDAIAHIGMASRFLGAKNVNEFWQQRDGVESIFIDMVNNQEEIKL
jgi:acyl transferase domain-containing protein